MQVTEAIFKYGRQLGVKVVPIYGGQPIFRQLQALDRGVHVVVGTPGRVLDHIGRGSLTSTASARSCSTRPTRCSTWASPTTSSRSSARCPTERQTVLFSATMPPRIDGIAKRYLDDPVRIKIGGAPSAEPSRR